MHEINRRPVKKLISVFKFSFWQQEIFATKSDKRSWETGIQPVVMLYHYAMINTGNIELIITTCEQICGEVMFLHLSVILSTVGVSAYPSMHLDWGDCVYLTMHLGKGSVYPSIHLGRGVCGQGVFGLGFG